VLAEWNDYESTGYSEATIEWSVGAHVGQGWRYVTGRSWQSAEE
jgi:hypothetical protein